MRPEDRKKLVARMVRWGYLDEFYGGLEPDEVTDAELVAAVSDYQAFHEVPLDELTANIHGRTSAPDGDVGPATLLLMNQRTCDVKDPVIGRGSEANWPEPCRDEITVSWNFKQAPGLTQEQTTGIWESVKEEYEELFELGLKLYPGQYPRTRIYAALKALPGSTLAWSYLAQNNCAARLRQAYDSTTRWSVPLATGTWKHEVGHALGLEHTPSDRNSLMYPSMNGQTGLNETDIRQMIQKGYKRRTTPVDPVDPVDPDNPIKVTVLVDGKFYRHQWSPADGALLPDLSPF